MVTMLLGCFISLPTSNCANLCTEKIGNENSLNLNCKMDFYPVFYNKSNSSDRVKSSKILDSVNGSVNDNCLNDARNITEKLRNNYNISANISIVTMDDILTGKGDLYSGDIIQLSMNNRFIYAIFLEMIDGKIVLNSGGTFDEVLSFNDFKKFYTGIKIVTMDLSSKQTVLDKINEIQSLDKPKTEEELEKIAHDKKVALASEILGDVGMPLSIVGSALLTGAFISLMTPEPVVSKVVATGLAITGLVISVAGSICSWLSIKVLSWF
mgnify:CR=1 FL=1